jgi:hypothetical protein
MLSRRTGMIRLSLTLSVVAFGILLSTTALAAHQEPSNDPAAPASSNQK